MTIDKTEMRQRYSCEFKAQVIAECDVKGSPVASLRARWRRDTMPDARRVLAWIFHEMPTWWSAEPRARGQLVFEQGGSLV